MLGHLLSSDFPLGFDPAHLPRGVMTRTLALDELAGAAQRIVLTGSLCVSYRLANLASLFARNEAFTLHRFLLGLDPSVASGGALGLDLAAHSRPCILIGFRALEAADDVRDRREGDEASFLKRCFLNQFRVS